MDRSRADGLPTGMEMSPGGAGGGGTRIPAVRSIDEGGNGGPAAVAVEHQGLTEVVF